MPPVQPNPAHRVSPRRGAPATQPEIVNPIWLVKALSLCVVGALICAYATLCLLFYQGRWQLVLHPSLSVARTPASAGLAYTEVHFDATATGQPRLTGWWVPSAAQAGSAGRYGAYTVLYLHDGSGSLADTVPMLARLHAEGINAFAIDYRGFGGSDASIHPTQDRMTEDVAAALNYLTQTRHISPDAIIPYGVGLGASLAASLAKAHPELPAVILDNPDPDPAATAFASHPSHVVPVRLLFGDAFDISTAISTLRAPKLLISGGPNSHSVPDDRLGTLFRQAVNPSFSVSLRPESETEYQAALSRFLDQYLPGAQH